MTVFLLAAVLIFLFIRYLLQKEGKRLFLDKAVAKWKTSRKRIITTLRQSAHLLKSSYRQKAEAERTSAKKNLVGDIISLGGVMLAPFSGGLSLFATGAAALTTVNSLLTNRAANKKHDENLQHISEKVKEVEEQDKRASDELNIMLRTFDYLEEQASIMKIDNIVSSVQQSSKGFPGLEHACTKEKMDWTKTETENIDRHFQPDEFLMPYGLPKQVAHLTSGEEHVPASAKNTKEVSSQTKSINKAASLAVAVQNFSKNAKALSHAKQAGNVKNTRQVSDTAKTVYKATMNKFNSLHSTKITSNTGKLSKVSQTATKAATVSKVGLVISAVAIPVDIYNLVQSTANLDKLPDDVKEIEDKADRLEEDFENTCNLLLVRCECMEKLHKQLYKLYEDHQIEGIYDYLLLMYEKLGYDTPVPY